MKLLLFDFLMTSYTNARPKAGLLVDLNLGTALAVRLRGADEREIGSGGPVKAVLKRWKRYTWKLCCTQVPRSVFSPSVASFLKRTANASFVPRLLSMGPSMSASVYRGLRGCNFDMRRAVKRATLSKLAGGRHGPPGTAEGSSPEAPSTETS
jgi:hypothetical protein